MGVAPSSIHTLEPLEDGGTNARNGFDVQDQVAARFCLEMVTNETLDQVWTESQDDVLLLWKAPIEEVEFVQVKSNKLDKLWSIAELLKKKGTDENDSSTSDGNGKPRTRKKQQGRCILEKSLQYDRCSEQVRFRIVTCRDVKQELEFLTYELDSPHRDKTKPDYLHLLATIKKKVSDVKSKNGRGCEFWLDRTYWECVHSGDVIISANVVKILELVHRQGQYMGPDQAREIYQRLQRKVYEGGLAKWKLHPDKKKFVRNDFIAWLKQAINDQVHPALLGTGKKLQEKLREAGIPIDEHEAAAEMRLRYRLEGLSPKYSQPTAKQQMEGEIAARLLLLRANLDGGIIEESGVRFHARCLNEIVAIRESLPEENRPPLHNMFGYMYNLTDRCIHRFVRAKP